ncbi:HAD family hydrolase [Rhizohabitans arisaemae]|uniref:HAD family hydrolase n=1 Tax=Rhizohabitans arisaemae TaxID=2720610 RepID=UPI0024B1267C|nr:HAD family hydrolase [Rhizohabitans arisaemae]
MRIPLLVATDLDGTALRADGTVSPRTAAAFSRIEASGALLIFVTGRPPRWMADVVAAVEHRGLAVCANGALVYDLHTEKIVKSVLIRPEILDAVVRRLRRGMPELAFSVEYERGFAHGPGFDLGPWDSLSVADAGLDLAELVARPCAKLLAQHPGMGPGTLHALVTELVGDLVTATYSGSRGLVEMSAHGVTKATALAQLAVEHGVDARDVVAFGDMPNDLPMLMWAGTSYAVANAHPDVLAVVHHVTAANNDDGVAQVLEKLYR